MSEHEGALFDAIVVIAETLLDLGTDPEKVEIPAFRCARLGGRA